MEYPGSAVFYFFILTFVTLLSLVTNCNLKKNLKRFVVLLIVTILSCVAGFRGITVGIDTRAYYEVIYSIEGSIYYGMHGISEPGFILLTRLLTQFIHSIPFVLLIFSLLTNGLIISRLWTVRESISFPLAIFSYVCLYYFLTYNVLRQWLAVAIIIYAIKYINKNRYFPFMIMVLIAYSFHYSALIALIMVPIDMIINKKNKNVFVFLFLFSPFVIYGIYVLINETSIVSQYQDVINTHYTGKILSLSMLFRSLFLLFTMLFVKKNKESYVFLRHTVTFYCVYLVIGFLGVYNSMISRVSWYFAIYEIVYYGLIVKISKGRSNILFRFIIVCFCLYLFVSGLIGNSNGQMPYIPFWKKILLSEEII